MAPAEPETLINASWVLEKLFSVTGRKKGGLPDPTTSLLYSLEQQGMIVLSTILMDYVLFQSSFATPC